MNKEDKRIKLLELDYDFNKNALFAVLVITASLILGFSTTTDLNAQKLLGYGAYMFLIITAYFLIATAKSVYDLKKELED